MSTFLRTLVALVFVASAASLMASPASAGDPKIEAAKEQGVVGERIDGYLGIVSGGADASLMRRVQDINNKRRAAYDDLAKDTGTTPEQVARVTGEKLISQAGRGEYIMDESGSWKKK
ncbi:YdbL family protein [Henriciella aquimarina]|uniref:YdbL family protein n=1 Tax=Henriciella aquimarina TaxID=545261 RepID=UPI000A029A58|nr:YdbL family protein [Henriciella aquimarina]